MNSPTFHRIGVVANLKKEGVTSLLEDVLSALVREGFDVFIDAELKPLIDDQSKIHIGIPDDCDLIAALGGDGTILHVARRYAQHETPILGFKAGRLGFLTETLSGDGIPRIKAGRFKIQERMRITASIRQDDETIETFSALNDVVVHGAGFSRMVTLRSVVDGVFLREYRADGLILATPTGSTAYSLSAGGPLLTPTIQAIVLSPLCPHSLSIRPIVLDADQQIVINVVSPRSDIRVTVDGQVGSFLEDGQHVVVERSEKVTRLVVPQDYDFFNLLREKL